ncbi:MAG: sugar ABC transporter substrate-binding protein [Spirochaetaceae bacterium]|nr:MAG: sugar ABC transporter substrate-binding protein [Spirochaetaceae bacterium]
MREKQTGVLLLAVMLLAVVMMPVFAAGGREAAAPAAIDPDAEVSGEITVWGWNVAASSFEVTAQLFMEKYPNTRVNVVDMGRGDVYDRVTVGLSAGGQGLADVIQLDERLPSFSYNFPEGFMDLTDLLRPYVADFDPSKIPVISLEDGRMVGVPWDSGPVGVFYRRDLFEQAGVDPAAIETWDDYLEAGRKIKDATGAHLFQVDMANDDGTLRMFLNQQANFYFNEQGEIIIHKPKAVEAMAFLKRANDMGLALNTPSWDAILTGTKNGTLATIPFGVWYSGSIKDVAPELAGKWGVFPLPSATRGGNRAANLGGSNLVIPRSTQNPDLAWQYARFSMLTTQGQMAIMKAYGIFPSYLPAHNDPFFSAPDPYFGNQRVWQVFTDQMSDIPPINYTDDFQQAEQIVTDAQARVLLQGADPATEMRRAADEIARVTGRRLAP